MKEKQPEKMEDLSMKQMVEEANSKQFSSVMNMPSSDIDFLDLSTSDGSTAAYYELPHNASELQHLISYKDMNAQIGEIFRACYRYGEVFHSGKLRDAKKIKFYIEAEIARLEKTS